MFEFDGKEYELKYNLKRVEMIEGIVNMPTLASLRKGDGMLALTALKVYFAYALKEQGGDSFVKPKKGMEMAETLLESEGYARLNLAVIEAMERDCPFFFQDA